jgi:hypothetical protein
MKLLIVWAWLLAALWWVLYLFNGQEALRLIGALAFTLAAGALTVARWTKS